MPHRGSHLALVRYYGSRKHEAGHTKHLSDLLPLHHRSRLLSTRLHMHTLSTKSVLFNTCSIPGTYSNRLTLVRSSISLLRSHFSTCQHVFSSSLRRFSLASTPTPYQLKKSSVQGTTVTFLQSRIQDGRFHL